MRKLIYHMMYRLPGIILGLLAVAFAAAQKPVDVIPLDQCEEINISVQEFPGDRYEWDLYPDPDVNFAVGYGEPELDQYFFGGIKTGSEIKLFNLPAGRYFLRVMVWDEANYDCTNNLLLFILDVAEPMAWLEEPDPFCYGEVNSVNIVLTGIGPWDIVYAYDDGTGVQMVNLNGLKEMHFTIPADLKPNKYEFWIMEVYDGCVRSYPDPKKVNVIIHPKPRTSGIYIKPREDEEQKP